MNTHSFSDMDASIIRNMMHTKRAKDIAAAIGAGVSDVAAYISQLGASFGLISYEEKHKILHPKPRAIKKNGKQKSLKEEMRDEARKQQLQLEAARKEQMEQRLARQSFKTRQIDYASMVSIRIDRKTVIFSKPGEEVATKEKFLKTYKPMVD